MQYCLCDKEWTGGRNGDDRLKTLRFFKRDMRLGMIRRLFMYAVPIMISFMQVKECYGIFEYMNSNDIIFSKGTVIDYLLYCTQGMRIFRFDPKEYFLIPIYWFLFQIYISYVIAYYSNDDYHNNGLNLFIASRSRLSWWNAKCLWCTISIVVYYLIYVVSIGVFAVAFGAKPVMYFTCDFVSSVFDPVTVMLDFKDVFVMTIAVPFVVTLGLCLLQIFLGFILNPVTSFAIISGVYIVSAYYTEWWLPGSFTMWLRSSVITDEGVRPVSGVLFGLIAIIIAWYGGKIYFDEKDVL